jgi:lipopolysaccharide export system protein LptC
VTLSIPVPLRWAAAIAGLVLLSWVGYEIGRAGDDVTIPRVTQPSTLTGGEVSGKRINGQEWSMDYDTAVMSADDSQVQIAHVRDGRIHRAGKPDVRMHADDVTINTTSNDLFVNGPVSFVEDEGKGRKRTFATVGARYYGATHILELDHPATITDGGTTVKVATMTIDFRTGDAHLGALVGEQPGQQP